MTTNLPAFWRRRAGDLELRMADMSLHGLFVETDECPAPGWLMSLQVVLPTGPVDLFAEVCFVGTTQSGTGVGLEIFAMSEPDRDRWTAYYHGLVMERLERLRASEREDQEDVTHESIL